MVFLQQCNILNVFLAGILSSVQASNSLVSNTSLASSEAFKTCLCCDVFSHPLTRSSFLLWNLTWLFHTLASLNKLSRACPFCFWGAECQNYTAKLKGTLLLHYAYQVHSLYFHFHLHLRPAVGTLLTPCSRPLAQANILATPARELS